MANAKASSNLQALPTSPSPAQTLPCDAVHNALKMILFGAPLNEVLTTITRMIKAHTTGMLSSISLLDEDGLHLRYAEWTARGLVNSHDVARRQSAGDILHVLRRSPASRAGRNSVDRLRPAALPESPLSAIDLRRPDKGIRTDREIRIVCTPSFSKCVRTKRESTVTL
jgi:hypothetical protein